MGTTPINELKTDMSAIEMYYYFFYKLHTFIKALQPKRSGSKFRTIMMLSFLEFWLIAPFFIYSNIFLQQRNTIQLFSLGSIPFIMIVLIKWFAFIRNNRWEDYAQKFDQWPKEQNLKGTYIVVGVCLFIIANLTIAAYLASILLPNPSR